MLGTEDGRYDAPEDAHLFLLCRCHPRPWHRGLVPAHLARRIVERFRCLTLDCCEPGVRNMKLRNMKLRNMKHRAFCDPATTAFRSCLGNCTVLVAWNCVSSD